MAGRVKGAASRITAKYTKAIYTHCVSHRLNLCIVKCCSISEVNNAMQVADKIARFFSNSPKRQATLEIWIQDILQGKKRKSLKEMCRTRWVEHHEAFELFSDLFMPIISCLEAISQSTSLEWNRDSRSDAESFLLALSQFSFIVGLHITQAVLGYTKGLSIKLQGKYVDVDHAHRDIEQVKSTLLNARRNVESLHKVSMVMLNE